MPSTRALRSSFSSSSAEKPLWRDIASRKYSLQQAQDALEAGVQVLAGAHFDGRAAPVLPYGDALLLDDLTAWSLGSQEGSSSPRLGVSPPQWTIVNPFGGAVTEDDVDQPRRHALHHAHRQSVSPSWLASAEEDEDDGSSVGTSARSSSSPLFPFKRDSRCPSVIATSPSPPRAAARASNPSSPPSSSSSASVREAARALFALSSEAEREEAMELAAQWKREETRMGRLSFQVKQKEQPTAERRPVRQAQAQRQSLPQAPARPQRRMKAASLPPLLQPPPVCHPRAATKAAKAAAAAAATSSSTAGSVPSSPQPDSSCSSSESGRTRDPAAALESVANELACMAEMARSQSPCDAATMRSRSPSPLMWGGAHHHQYHHKERRPSIAGIAAKMMMKSTATSAS